MSNKAINDAIRGAAGRSFTPQHPESETSEHKQVNDMIRHGAGYAAPVNDAADTVQPVPRANAGAGTGGGAAAPNITPPQMMNLWLRRKPPMERELIILEGDKRVY